MTLYMCVVIAQMSSPASLIIIHLSALEYVMLLLLLLLLHPHLVGHEGVAGDRRHLFEQLQHHLPLLGFGAGGEGRVDGSVVDQHPTGLHLDGLKSE